MRIGLYCSLALHLSIALLIFYGLPTLLKEPINNDYAIVAEVVPVSAITNVKVRTAQKVAEAPKEAQPKAAPEAKEQPPAKTEPQKPQEAKQKESSDAEKVPDKNIKQKEPQKPQEVKKEEVKKDQKKDEKKKIDDFAQSILKSLEKDVKKRDDTKKADKTFADVEKALKGETNKEYNPNIPMSISEVDGIKSQITRTWNTSSFSGAAQKGMQVIVKIELDMSGNVISARPQLEKNNSPYYTPFVESAVRAVMAASPIQNLTKDKYGQWKEIEFRFDSTGMIY